MGTGARGGTHTTRRPRGDTRACSSARRRRGSPGRAGGLMTAYARTRRARRSACQRRARRASDCCLSYYQPGVLINVCTLSALSWMAASPPRGRRTRMAANVSGGSGPARRAPTRRPPSAWGERAGLDLGAGAVSRALLIEIDRPAYVCTHAHTRAAHLSPSRIWDLGSFVRPFVWSLARPGADADADDGAANPMRGGSGAPPGESR